VKSNTYWYKIETMQGHYKDMHMFSAETIFGE